jgi:arylsulfatase A-like enzyme
VAGAGVPLDRAAGRRPNILFCIADDWAWPHAGAYGDKVVQTPNFDRVAREGVLFSQAFCAAPSCTPSRSGVLTGQWIHRLAEGGNLNGTMSNRFPVYPDLLEASGYWVGLTGKGWSPGNFQAGGWKRNPAGENFPGFEKFLQERPAGKPFCFWFGSKDPHRGYEPGSGVASGLKPEDVVVPPYLPDRPEVRRDILDYYFAVQRFDRDLGEHLRLLEAAGELDHTIVVVSADNGWPFPYGKTSLYDAGSRQPLAIRWPARFKGGRVVETLVSLTDLAPTFLHAAGLTPPPDMTGRNLLPLLDGKPLPGKNRVLLERERHANVREGDLSYPSRALRTPEFLFVRNFHPERWPVGDPDPYLQVGRFGDIDGSPTKDLIVTHRHEPAIAPFFKLTIAKRPAEELYDLAKDPHQIHNLAGQTAYASIQKKLRAELETWLKETGDPRMISDDEPWNRYKYFFPQRPGGRYLSRQDMAQRAPNFRAQVRLQPDAAAGVVQGFKPDLMFKDKPTRRFMIWPRFLGADLVPLPDGKSVPPLAVADFWFGNDREEPAISAHGIKVGTLFLVSDGATVIGEAEVLSVAEKSR